MKDDNNTLRRWTETERESGSYFHRHFQNLNPLSSINNNDILISSLPPSLSPSLPSLLQAQPSVSRKLGIDTTTRAVVQYTSSRMHQLPDLDTTSNILHWLPNIHILTQGSSNRHAIPIAMKNNNITEHLLGLKVLVGQLARDRISTTTYCTPQTRLPYIPDMVIWLTPHLAYKYTL